MLTEKSVEYKKTVEFKCSLTKKKLFRFCFLRDIRKRSDIEKEIFLFRFCCSRFTKANPTYFMLKNMLSYANNYFLLSVSFWNTPILYRFSFYCIRVSEEEEGQLSIIFDSSHRLPSSNYLLYEKWSKVPDNSKIYGCSIFNQ